MEKKRKETDDGWQELLQMIGWRSFGYQRAEQIRLREQRRERGPHQMIGAGRQGTKKTTQHK